MITFEIKLSVNQIACLKAIRAMNDGQVDQLFNGLPNWISGTRMLIAERLITWTDPKELNVPAARTDEAVREITKKIWQITRKGRLVLELFELDVMDAAESVAEKVSTLTGKQVKQIGKRK